MKEKRKYAIVLAFVAAAILTPPDPISQIGLALPTILLYEISIILVRIIEKKRDDIEGEGEDDDYNDVDDDLDNATESSDFDGNDYEGDADLKSELDHDKT